MTANQQHVAVDIGGTFTDLVAIDSATGEIVEAKVPTTPADFSEGVLEALESGIEDTSSIAQLVHGTTVVINAITQRSGAKTALVTTRGFRDALAIGRGNRPDMYNLRFHKPVPFVPRKLRFEVNERVRADGTVEVPLALDELPAIAESCRSQNVEAVAICFLHSYAHPEHELETARTLEGLLPDVVISISSEITKEWREYERSSTVVLDAYTKPASQRYLDHLDSELASISAASQRFAMTSNGGTATFSFAREQPIQLVESGPAGGIIGAQRVGQQLGEPNVITLDIGGTTAKCSIVVDGQVEISGDYRLEHDQFSPGYPVKIPVLDIVEIGAGGGSVVWFDGGGGLRIGPQSSGADPGPACYGIGGTHATITDALVLSGYIQPGPLPGGGVSIDRDLAHQAFTPISKRLKVTVQRAVSGVLDLFTEMTVDALKLVSVRRGHDPRDFVLVAFGGGGPLHAARLGAELGVERVLVPRYPATFSAWGMLQTQPRIDLTRTGVRRLDETPVSSRLELLEQLGAEATMRLESQGFSPNEHGAMHFALDMRYHGQEHTVRVQLPDPNLPDLALVQEFHRQHRKMYTFALEETPIELVNFRATVTVQARPEALAKERIGATSTPNPDSRHISVGDQDTLTEVLVYNRSELPHGYTGAGPVLIDEAASTSVIPAGSRFEIDQFGNIVISSVDARIASRA